VTWSERFQDGQIDTTTATRANGNRIASPATAGLSSFLPILCVLSSIKAMKLDATDLRYVTSEEFRVLTAVRNHFWSSRGVVKK